MRRLKVVVFLYVSTITVAGAQDYRWQQRVEYTMNVRLDAVSHHVAGTQKLVYYNNSKDTLRKVFYHLYFNAFQPGSMMDVRSRNLPDPDPRVGDRISKLKDDEIGYQHVQSLKQDGKDVSYAVDGTILEVTLAKPILPGTKTTFEMNFESQVPLQIRRSGRDNKEGVAFSMTQWYPKIAEYDYQGWHPYQYVAREFHSVWGDFDVTITTDPALMIAATGKLQNPEKVGFGYEKPGTSVQRPKGDLTWHFIAKNVIDFAWTADTDYIHDQAVVPDGPVLHFFYQNNSRILDTWKKMEDYAVKHFQFMNKTFGKYPYESYSIIQGGDGGMEYPMCTLITGERSFGSLVGVMAHEAAHSWFQAMLASNEALYPWMDEGFTDFSSNESMSAMFNTSDPHLGSYNGYFNLVKSGLQEPASQHADHYNTNRAYSVIAYNMGSVFLHQLKYIVGESVFYRGMRNYISAWKFKHPSPNDFIRIMEKTSGMQLKWYLNYWINTTKHIDYGIKTMVEGDGATYTNIERVGEFPMPVDVLVTLKDGSKELYYIPLNETLGRKPVEDQTMRRFDLEAWPWVNPTYMLKINHKAADIASVEIDPSQRMADINRTNNFLDLSEPPKPYQDQTR